MTRRRTHFVSLQGIFSSQPGHTLNPHFLGHSQIFRETTADADIKYSGVTDIEMREALFDNNDYASEDKESPAVQ